MKSSFNFLFLKVIIHFPGALLNNKLIIDAIHRLVLAPQVYPKDRSKKKNRKFKLTNFI